MPNQTQEQQAADYVVGRMVARYLLAGLLTICSAFVACDVNNPDCERPHVKL